MADFYTYLVLPPTTAEKGLEIEPEAFGYSYLYMPNESYYNTAYINVLSKNDSKNIKKKLTNVFKPNFEVRTIDDLKNSISGRISLELKIINLAGTISLIVGGICLCFTFIVFIFERVKDFSVFKAIGIKGKNLSKFILIELMNLVAIGVVIGICLGLSITAFYIKHQHYSFLDFK